MSFAKYAAAKIAGPALGVFSGFMVFSHRHDITGWFIHGIPWRGIGIVCLVIACFAAAIGILILLVWNGFGGIITGLIVLLMVAGVGGAVYGAFQPSQYRGYTPRVVTVRQGQTLAQLCARWRPTWTLGTCHDRLAEENRAANVDQLRPGDRLFFDKSEGHKNNGNDYRDLQDYQSRTVTIGAHGQFKSLASACDVLRPTWKVKPCAAKITKDNPILAPGAKLWTVTIPVDL